MAAKKKAKKKTSKKTKKINRQKLDYESIKALVEEENERDEHARNSPSGAVRWMNCAGSINLIEKVGKSKKQSPQALEGSIAHKYAELILKKKAKLSDIKDRQMRASVGVFVEHCENYILSYFGPGYRDPDSMMIEEKISLKHLGIDCWGTVDFSIWQPKRTVITTDFKNGNVTVSEKNNAQLKIYNVGIAEKVGYEFPAFANTIVQPNASHPKGPVRYEYIDGHSLLKFRDEVVKAAKATEKKNAKRKAGSWCEWCPAKNSCPEFKKEVKMLAKVDFDREDNKMLNPKDPKSLTDNQLRRALAMAPAIKNWITQAEEELKQRLFEEERPELREMFKLAKKLPRSSWINDSAFDELVEEYEVNPEEAYNVKPIGITEMRGVLKGMGYSNDQITEIIGERITRAKHKPFSMNDLTVVSVDDSRETYIPAKLEFPDDIDDF